MPDLYREFGLDRLPSRFAERPLANLLDLSGRVAVIVGGSGEDLGRAIAMRLAELGASVAIVGRGQAVADAAADAVRARWGGGPIGVAADAADWDAIHAAMDRIGAELGPVDILVNNVGGSAGDGPFMSRAQRDIDGILALNLSATVYATHAALGGMVARGSGSIVNVASEGGKLARANLGMFCTAKAAVIAFTSNLSREVGPQGVRVVAVCPGAMSAADYAADARHPIMHASLGRASTPDEVARVIAYLASDAASYIHGTAISVGGGMTA